MLFLCLREDQMPDPRRAGNVAGQTLFQFVIGQRLPLVLALMFRPRTHQEYLHVAVTVFRVIEDSPLGSTIAAPYTFILMDRFHEVCFAFWKDLVFDRHQHRSLTQNRSIRFDHDRHTPVVPWSQVASRFGEFGEKNHHCTRDGSQAGNDESRSDACPLGESTPSGAAKSEATLINQDEDGKNARSYPIGSQALDQGIDQRNKKNPRRPADQHDRSKCAQAV